MSHLTDEDREALLTPCACGHTINDHGSLVACWRCEDEGGDCETPFEALLAARIEALLAEARAEGAREALLDAADRWTQGGWADVMLPKPTPPAVPVIAYANRVGDWLRDRAEQTGDAP